MFFAVDILGNIGQDVYEHLMQYGIESTYNVAKGPVGVSQNGFKSFKEANWVNWLECHIAGDKIHCKLSVYSHDVSERTTIDQITWELMLAKKIDVKTINFFYTGDLFNVIAAIRSVKNNEEPWLQPWRDITKKFALKWNKTTEDFYVGAGNI